VALRDFFFAGLFAVVRFLVAARFANFFVFFAFFAGFLASFRRRVPHRSSRFPPKLHRIARGCFFTPSGGGDLLARLRSVSENSQSA
jgi:hypothetical protein